MDSRLFTANAGIDQLSVEDIARAGLPQVEALEFHQQLQQILRETCSSPAHTWLRVSKELLLPRHPFCLHQLLYYSSYWQWDCTQLGPPPAWMPSLESAKSTNIGQVLERLGKELLGPEYKDPISSFSKFYQFSVKNPDAYWGVVLDELNISFSSEPQCILDQSAREDAEQHPEGKWLPGATLNAAESCLKPHRRRKEDDIALIWREEGDDDIPLKTLTYGRLSAQVCQVANSLEILGFAKGDPIAIDMPMTVNSVVIYLAIVLAGYVVVSIADSFAATEIETRIRLSNAKGIFTQDVILRGMKVIPLYERVVEAKAPLAIVLPGRNSALTIALREGDISWDVFLEKASSLNRPFEYQPVVGPVDAMSNILFSSGTTGEPKAIPWTHLTPIKAAADAWAHHDIKAGDVISWPTNLGWMMGPWLIYAALFNAASIALYGGSPLGTGFARFIQDAKVTMLGLVPSLAKTWKLTDCVKGYDWSSIRCFSSSGEASNVDDYLWLMGRACYKPVIEYCGGTEIGGGFLTGSMLQRQALTAFSTPAMGCTIFILDENGNPLPPNEPGTGEVALDPVFLGASTELLNANHYDVYFKGMPSINGKILRRHGDAFECIVGGFYKAHGRVDDTMNLGGIKVSSVELERVCNGADENVLETAAIGVPPTGGGPEQLVIVTVLKDNQRGNREELKQAFNIAIQQNLNPLFKVNAVALAPSLPRTASNKVMRRRIRAEFDKTDKRHGRESSL